MSATSGITNPVMNILARPHRPRIVGRVIILKNRLVGGWCNMTPNIDAKALEQTLWWYHRSGRDIGTVFTKRGLMHLTLSQI